MLNLVAAAGGPELIQDPGIPISLREENNLKLACYLLRFKIRISFAVILGDIILANIYSLTDYRE